MRRNYYCETILILIALSCASICCSQADGSELLVYCGAGMKEPVQEIARQFEKETGVRVTCVYGGSGVLMAKIEAQKTGDVFMPGSLRDMKLARKNGWVVRSAVVVSHKPVIMTASGNPKNIKSVRSLANDGLTVSLGSEKACAIGGLTVRMLAGLKDRGDKIRNSANCWRMTVTELALDVVLGEADAAIVWRATAEKYCREGRASIVEIDGDCLIVESVPAGVLKFSADRETASVFIKYIVSNPDIWTDYGYEVPQ